MKSSTHETHLISCKLGKETRREWGEAGQKLIYGVFIHELELENDRGAVETSFSFFIARFYQPNAIIRTYYFKLKLKEIMSTLPWVPEGFSCAVSGVGHAFIVTRFAGRAVGLRPPKRSEEFPSVAREKKPLVLRVCQLTMCLEICINRLRLLKVHFFIFPLFFE